MTRAQGSTTLLRTDRSKTLVNRGIAAIAALLCALMLAYAPAVCAYADESSGASSAIGNLENGTYLIDVTMAGGTGKATVESPATLEVEDGKAFATLVWSSENYDYMVVNGETIKPLTQNPTSRFRVPVSALDTALEMIGDTTAMGTPHEISYTFTFVSSTLQKTVDGDANGTQQSGQQQSKGGQAASSTTDPDTERILQWVTIGSLVVALIAIGITIGVLRGYRKRR